MTPREPLAFDVRIRSLLAMLQLASPALPVGGFAYSQGLESAIEHGDVTDEPSALRWIEDALRLVLARYEAPMFLRLYDAWLRADTAAIAVLNGNILAARETRELREESRQMGASLVRLLPTLGIAAPALDPIAFTSAFACACAGLAVDREASLACYLWAWCENQVLAAVKTVPLGQMAGQRMLLALHRAIGAAVTVAGVLPDDQLGTAAPRFAIASARHEHQYSRLFRS